jgi:hypothetical protein
MNTLNPPQIRQLKAFSECYIEHPNVKKILADFDDLRESRYFHSDIQSMLITGDTGVGKSHLINHYKKRVLASQETSKERVPILETRISSHKGLDNTLIQILSDLDLFGSDQRASRKYKLDLKQKVVNSLIKAEVELLIINEFQELIEFKTVQERQIIANALKFISEEAKVPIVLVGMPWAIEIADEPQWSSRLVRRHNIDYFNLQEGKRYYLQYLKSLAKQMPFDIPPKLELAHTAIALYAISNGVNRALKHFLLESVKLALLDESKDLDNKYFIATYNKLFTANHRNKNSMNPFTQKVKDIKISTLEKGSSYNSNALNENEMITSPIFSTPTPIKQI